MDRFEAKLVGDPDIDHWSSYVGQNAVRFVLAYDVQPSSPNLGQIVIVTKDIDARERVRTRLQGIARQEFVGIDLQLKLLPARTACGTARCNTA